MRLKTIDLNSAADVQKFILFPFQLYKDSANWVPPIISDVKTVLNPRKHPFYKHSQAQFFIIEDHQGIKGRIAVLNNRNFNDFHNSKTAFIYYFDVVDDQDVATMLFKAAVDWAASQNLDTILGPKGFVRSQGFGVLVEGFDHLPAVGIPYNHSYYEKLFKTFGFQKHTDHLSGFFVPSYHFPEKITAAAEKIKERGKFRVQKFSNKDEMKPWINQLEKIHHRAFKNNADYYPSTLEEFELMAQSIINIAQPGLIKLILKEDEVAGFVLGYPNIGPALQKIGGKLWPFGWITLLREMKTSRRIDMNGVGLLPEYQGFGANILLYSEVEKTLRDYGATYCELVQVDERNFKSFSDMETLGVQWYKRHRTYIYKIPKQET